MLSSRNSSRVTISLLGEAQGRPPAWGWAVPLFWTPSWARGPFRGGGCSWRLRAARRGVLASRGRGAVSLLGTRSSLLKLSALPWSRSEEPFRGSGEPSLDAFLLLSKLPGREACGLWLANSSSRDGSQRLSSELWPLVRLGCRERGAELEGVMATAVDEQVREPSSEGHGFRAGSVGVSVRSGRPLCGDPRFGFRSPGLSRDILARGPVHGCPEAPLKLCCAGLRSRECGNSSSLLKSESTLATLSWAWNWGQEEGSAMWSSGL